MNLSPSRRDLGGLLIAGLVTSPGLASAKTSAPQADRRAILAMAGNYRVRFDFRETVSFLPDYRPIAPAGSGGDEAVRVIEDAGDIIRLQHILVMKVAGEVILTKHWRQDWTYEPAEVLAYAGPDSWKIARVSSAMRRGAWSQTVWQTDDSPRYGGVGRWEHDAGVSRWTSAPTLRPLARRDAVRRPPYDRYEGANRHALTPTGWVHEQDNAKIGLKNGRLTTFVHENVLNTYERSTAFDPSPADLYWSHTGAYWVAVRRAWDDKIKAGGGGVRVKEVADTGAETVIPLMDLADEIDAGRKQNAEAIAEARRVIAALPARA